jgi:pyruvate dehydrogenase E2 component (dihydrolipoamide acetyltransferase)
MPRLSDTMSEGAVGRWLKKPGDRVQRDEVIAEIETDKATMDLVSFEDGTLQEIRVPEGKIVPIGEIIGVIGEGTVVAVGPAEAGPRVPQGEREAVGSVRLQPDPGASRNGPHEGENSQLAERVKASPVARRIAGEFGVDLRSVPGTGPGGRILKANVEEFRRRSGPAIVAAPGSVQPAGGPAAVAHGSAAPAPALVKGEVTPLPRIRRAVARAMAEAKPGVPHIYLTIEIDMAPAMALRAQIKETQATDVPISPNDLIVMAAARALGKHPELNASYATTAAGQPGLVAHQQINVSVAVATDNGLLAPVVKDADKKGLAQIGTEIRDLAARARTGSLKQHELEGATFQTSNLGMFGVVEFVSIVTMPLAASLAIGAIRQVPIVQNGTVTVGERLNVTLSVDHRVADGAAAAQYLQELTRLLQAPIGLLL